jgi:hypothetical protein
MTGWSVMTGTAIAVLAGVILAPASGGAADDPGGSGQRD